MVPPWKEIRIFFLMDWKALMRFSFSCNLEILASTIWRRLKFLLNLAIFLCAPPWKIWRLRNLKIPPFTRVPLALRGPKWWCAWASVETEESLDKLHLHSPKPSNLAEKSKNWLNVPKCQSTWEENSTETESAGRLLLTWSFVCPHMPPYLEPLRHDYQKSHFWAENVRVKVDALPYTLSEVNQTGMVGGPIGPFHNPPK